MLFTFGTFWVITLGVLREFVAFDVAIVGFGYCLCLFAICWLFVLYWACISVYVGFGRFMFVSFELIAFCLWV